MDIPVVLPWVGPSPERELYLVLTLWQRQKRRWSKSEQIYWLPSLIRRATPMGVWDWWSCIPMGFSNERCMPICHQREASTVIRELVSNPWEVCVSRILSGATFNFGKHAQCGSHLTTQEVSEALDWCDSGRHHPTGIGLDLQSISRKILEQQDQVTRRKTTRFYKVQWNNHSEDEATWKCKDYLRSNFSDFLPSR
jgi:hypothetical protein